MIEYYTFENENCLKNINENKVKIFIGDQTSIYGECGDCETVGYFIHEIDYGENIKGKNFRKLAKTNFFTYYYLFDVFDKDKGKDYIIKAEIPLIDFETGEILDKPGVFLDFEKPETLDEQLANIYQLTKDEQELMANSIKPWKDKLDVDADGLY